MVKGSPSRVRPRLPAFGLLEVLVAGSILAIVLAGVLTLLTRTLKANVLAQTRFLALSLAEDGLEVLHQMRDTNLIDENPATDWRADFPTVVPCQEIRRALSFDSASQRYRLLTTGSSEKINLAQNGTTLVFSRYVVFRSASFAQGQSSCPPFDFDYQAATGIANVDQEIVTVAVVVAWNETGECDDELSPCQHRLVLPALLSNWRLET